MNHREHLFEILFYKIKNDKLETDSKLINFSLTNEKIFQAVFSSECFMF